jgi:protein-disulfide isomerase
LVHKDLPLDIHDRAFVAAEAAHCAFDQHRFEEFRRVLLITPILDNKGLREAATSSGLALKDFDACLASRRYEGFVKNSVAEALRHGFYSTPTFVINGRVTVGVMGTTDLRNAIDEALAASGRPGL